DAEVERAFTRGLASTAKNSDAHETDGRRHSPAVLEEMREGFVARRIEIHRDAIDTILERLTRQVEAFDEGPQPPGLLGLWFGPVITPGELGSPEGDRLTSCGKSLGRRRGLLVHCIVDRAAEIPDGDDRAPLLG